MEIEVNKSEPKTQICGICILLGAAICSISLFTLVRYAMRAESPYTAMLLLRSLACTAGFVIIGIGIFTDKHHLFKIGLFSCAAAFVADAYFPFTWIKSNTDYYGSLSRGLSEGNFFLLAGYIAAAVGFLFMGFLFSQKAELRFPEVGSIAMICIAVYIVLIIGYGIYYTNENHISLWEFVTMYFSGSGLLSIVGAAGVLILPYVFSDEIPEVEIIKSLDPNNKGILENKAVTIEPAKMIISEDDIVDILRKYKQLLDVGIITDAEFQKKKSELLK